LTKDSYKFTFPLKAKSLIVNYIRPKTKMKKLISEAIENKRLLEFNYQGFYRIVEPHTFGMFSNGNELLIAYQIDGSSSSRKPPFWSNFQIAEIEDLSISDKSFSKPRDGYKKGDNRFKVIYCEL
jgi:hypothetical protein